MSRSLEEARNDIAKLIPSRSHDDGSYGPLFIRLSWHCSGTAMILLHQFNHRMRPICATCSSFSHDVQALTARSQTQEEAMEERCVLRLRVATETIKA